MKLRIKSISTKIIFLYIFLAIINMSIFSILIYANQVDIIAENNKFHAKELVFNIQTALKKMSKETPPKNRKEAIETTTTILGETGKLFVLFTESGTILHSSQANYKISDADIENGNTAVTNKDFHGKQFYAIIEEETSDIFFYLPMDLLELEDAILLLHFKINNMSKRLHDLYRLIIYIIIFIGIFHVVFGMLLVRLFVNPIQSLHRTSRKIQDGELTERAHIKNEDEIGELGMAFNSMADSIQEQITSLQQYYDRTDYELEVAARVQEAILPEIESDDRFNCSIFYKAFGKVSGDYYDIFKLDDSRYGFLIADVVGHGVPAALITMLAKEKFKLLAQRHNDPAELFQQVNIEIAEMLPQHEIFTFYFTAFYMILNADNTITFSNGGHVSPIIARVSEKKIEVLEIPGFVIGAGLSNDSLYETKQASLRQGDKIIFYTDGISEAFNDQDDQFEEERLIESITRSYTMPGEKIIDAIVTDLAEFTDIENLHDDATIFIIEIK